MRYFYKVLSPLGHKWVGVAERKLAEYERQRQVQKRPVFKKVTHFGDVLCLFHLTDQVKYFIIFGGGSGQILFSVPGDTTQTWAYDYLTDSLGQAINFEADVSGALHPFANGECHLGEQRYARLSGAVWSGGVITEGTTALSLGVIPAYEMEFLSEGTTIYARTATAYGAIANVKTGDQLLPSLSGPYAGMFGVAHHQIASPWNLYSGSALSYINPVNAATGESWVWVPSFFVVEPADGLGIPPGWYYGQYPSSDYAETALTSLNVSLLAVAKTCNSAATVSTGWCEMVTAVDGVATGDINFFCQDLLIPQNVTAYYERITDTVADSVLTIGTALPGFQKSFQLAATTLGQKPDSVDFWNFIAYGTQDAFGAVVVEGRKCRAYRYAGYLSTVVETNLYHSHVVNQNGSMLAIFESTDEAPTLISAVKVYDLFGTRVSATTEPATYTSGGFTEVRNSTVVTSLAATSGCFIPIRADGFTPSTSPLVLGEFVPAENPANTTRDYLSALATLIFRKDGVSSLEIRKVLCSNGIDAEYTISTDECFSSTVIISDPDIVTDTDKLVSAWGAGGIFKGKVRGDFSGVSGSHRFAGIGSGTEITLPETFGLSVDEAGNVTYTGTVGTVSPGSCIDENWQFVEDSCATYDCDNGTYVISASSSCGQTGTGGVEFTPISLTTSDYDAVVGDFYVATGGAKPISYSFDSGSISDEGEILSINGCGAPGSSRLGTITATDSCGNEASVQVKLPGGEWQLVSDVSISPSTCCIHNDGTPGYSGRYNPGCLDCYSGTAKVTACWTYHCDLDYLSGAHSCGYSSPAGCSISSITIIDRLITYAWRCP